MQERNLLILGAGQYGMVAQETAKAMGCFARIGFLDDRSSKAEGTFAEYERLRQTYDCAFVAMGNPGLRLGWLDKLEAAGYELPALIHPRAYIAPSAVLERGTIVEPMAVINTEVRVERGALLCAGCVVNHNAHVQPGCQIDCGAVVASNAVVPEGTKVSSGTVFERK